MSAVKVVSENRDYCIHYLIQVDIQQYSVMQYRNVHISIPQKMGF